MKKGRGRGLSIWVPFLFVRFREERTRADGRRRPAGPRPPSWVGMVRVCSVGLSCVLCSARRVRPGYRNAEAKVANLVKLWIRPALISGYWTATTGPTTSAIGRESSGRDARSETLRPMMNESGKLTGTASIGAGPGPSGSADRGTARGFSADEATDKEKIADYSVQIRS